jgi:hypothetical protein
MLLETLRSDWTARATNARVSALPAFADGALTLGAGTNLAEARADRRDDAAEGERAVALVAVAIGRPLDPSAATHVRRAVAKARAGDAPLALTHLALAGAGRLTVPHEDARRLFIADGLMKAGVAPSTILAALGAPSATADLERAYDPEQPRVPAGNGRPSGQWTSGDCGDETGEADDAATSVPNAGANSDVGGVQIADASDDWAQYLNPISPAEAAGRGGPPFNGPGPLAQHQEGVRQALQDYQAHGFVVVSDQATAVIVPGFATPRFYDFIVLDPIDDTYIGVEVKTTMYDTIFFDRSQVDKDLAIYVTGGEISTLGERVTEVAYEAYCTRCPYINLRSAWLFLRLWSAGVEVHLHPYPGGADFD